MEHCFRSVCWNARLNSNSIIRERLSDVKGQYAKKPDFSRFFALCAGPVRRYRRGANPAPGRHSSTPVAKGAASLFFKTRKRTVLPVAESAMRTAA
jgi:hypothetical protein